MGRRVAWVKHYCDRLDMPELLDVGPLAAHLDDMAALWSMENLTDGVIPKRQVRRLVDWTDYGVRGEDGRWREVTADQLAQALVDATPPRWEVVDGGYRIVDYCDRQETAAKIRGRRAADSARKAKNDPDGIPAGSGPDSGRNPNGSSKRNPGGPKEQENGRTENGRTAVAV